MSVAGFCGKGNLGEEYEEEAGLLLSRGVDGGGGGGHPESDTEE